MKKSKTIYLQPVFIILCVILVLYAAFYLASIIVPQQATRDFGKSDLNLDYFQRLLYAARLEISKNDLLLPINPQGDAGIFTIEYGETATEIAANLAEQGLIISDEAFTDLLIYLGNDQKIQAGIYTLSPAMSSFDIANHIVDTNPEDVVFSFLAGWRAEEITLLLPFSGLTISVEDFLQVVTSPSDTYLPVKLSQAASLEGFLFPDEYQILRSADAADLASALTSQFYNQLPSGYEENLNQMGLTLYDGVILASIIQKEMVVEDEGPLIAGVFLNRLKADMPLQSDPTVQYALGYDAASSSWWKNPLSTTDLQVASPYNTYLHAGLPPAPICNPGLTALMAVVNAEETPYLYFRAACDGSGRHIFSETYEEHLAAACP
jgi:UPF0755 protein